MTHPNFATMLRAFLAFCSVAALAADATSQKPRVLSHGDGKAASKASRQGSGHVVEFERPKGTWYLRAVEIHGSRYGRGYDPDETKAVITLCDEKMAALSEAEVAFSEFRTSPRWVKVEFPVVDKLPAKFRLVVDYDPTRSKGIYQYYCGLGKAKETHSYLGLPGQRTTAWTQGPWMIRAHLMKRKPKGPKKSGTGSKAPAAKGRQKLYVKDFEFLKRTVGRRFPAFEKKGVDWSKVCAEFEPKFRTAKDDRAHVRNVQMLLARLDDGHSGVTDARVSSDTPAFLGLNSAGLWIATEPGSRRVLFRAADRESGLAKKLRPGAELLEVDGRPAKLVLMETRRRLRTWHGWSSTHFLDARLSMTFFPFGERSSLSVKFLDPDGTVVPVRLPGHGPRMIRRKAMTMPSGLSHVGSAVSTKLPGGFGYIRILSGMGDQTVKAFHETFDQLRGVEGIVLDCRGMGGGGDRPALAIAGRFFTKRTNNGSFRPIKPTGKWQFDGPVVMLQDEREASSAETFTWAMTETGRVVSVGRPTAGMTIIPRLFDLPSRIAKFRLGCTDRKTPIRGVQPEGIGTAPDVYVPYEPALFDRAADPVLDVGTEILRLLLAQADREVVVKFVDAVLNGREAPRLRSGLSNDPFVQFLVGDYVRAAIDWQITLCDAEENLVPDFEGAIERLRGLAGLAERTSPEHASRAKDAVLRFQENVSAQRAFEALGEAVLEAKSAAVADFLEKYGKSRFAKALKSVK